MTEASPTKLNRLKLALTAGEPSFGLIATIPSIQTVQILASAGVDWLIISTSTPQTKACSRSSRSNTQTRFATSTKS